MFASLTEITLQPALIFRTRRASFTGGRVARWPVRYSTKSLLWSRFVTYKLNGLGQRYQKAGAGQFLYSTSTTTNTTTDLSPQAQSLAYNARYVYDEQGRLLGEYSPEGKLIQETIWLDDLPVATIRPKGSNNQLPVGIAGAGKGTANNVGNNTSTNPVNVELYYLHPDHLGTPRVATRSAAVNGATSGPNAINKAVWRWDSDPFGTSLGNSKPNENPQNVTGTASQVTAASFRVNNRFPGQLADSESGKYYNYFRDYDPAIGRYVESDPIGLGGGLSTYVYSGATPVSATDSFGLDYWLEGAAASEQGCDRGCGFHQSFCVGKPYGKRKCISFGRRPGQGNCWFNCKGHVYWDNSEPGPIEPDSYRYSDGGVDAGIIRHITPRIGQTDRYDILFGKNCRAFSQDLFAEIDGRFKGVPGAAPSPPKPGPKK
jgi:RHS repeat-associated protein